jgi:hypothetical protein
MPIDLYSSVKKTSKWAFDSPFLNNVLGSTLFVSIIIALIMILIIMIMYPAKSGTSFSVVLKMFFYMFIGSLVVLFLHDGIIKHMIEEEYQSDSSDVLMRGTTSIGRMESLMNINPIEVKPNLNKDIKIKGGNDEKEDDSFDEIENIKDLDVKNEELHKTINVTPMQLPIIRPPIPVKNPYKL